MFTLATTTEPSNQGIVFDENVLRIHGNVFQLQNGLIRQMEIMLKIR
jgi:hypothetical protein